jgi:hypothetical protein
MSEQAMPDCLRLDPEPAGPSGITGARSGLIGSCSRSSLEAMSSCATKQTVVRVACPPAVSQRGAKLPSSGGAPILIVVGNFSRPMNGGWVVACGRFDFSHILVEGI